jgi:choice-of-anchor C domain-containing protein
MTTRVGRRLRDGALALALMGTTTLVGLSVTAAPAHAAPVNLVQNGSFETLAEPTSSYLTVPAGDSSTISDWTVVTPSTYSGGGGSVDVVSNSYWNAEDGNYSIDLAGTTGVPGGLYQNVATTPGVQYSLSFWTAINGDEAPDNSHTIGISVNGTTVDTVQAVGVGRPLDWVQRTVAFTASSTTSKIEFDDTTPGDQNQGPALDNVSITAVSDVITASPVTVAPQTTGTSFTAPVATFTDSDPSAPLTNFAATITWGDGTTSNGVLSQSGSTYTVKGTHTYASHGTYTVGVSITSTGGGTASVSDSVTVADAVTTCTGSGCSGSVSTPSQNVQINSTSTAGTILTTVTPSSTGFSCGDLFRHAPQVVTVTDTGLNANIVYTVTFPNKSAAGSWLVPFAVCYQSQTPFKNLFGQTVTTGLLPLCTILPQPKKPIVAPCVQSITELPLYLGNVVEKIVVPPGDPKFH